jgi:prepilin-type N-terminal cleavage/methylation domain-containing protein
MPRSMRRIVLDQREEGFTLVELVVAMLIIGIVLVSVATVQVGTLQTNADNAARNTATALANGAMEQFRSIPWNVLRKGMASNYLTASGGDVLVSSGVLQVNDTSHTVFVAPSGASDQNLAKPWLPLFDSTGSHTQVINDPEGNGNSYRVKAYVTDNDAHVAGAVGIGVVVEWHRPGSTVIHYTSMFSSAYAPSGGCGSLDTAPFLTSCQPQYHSSANTASVTVLVSASEYDTATGDVGAPVPVVPGTTDGEIYTAGSRGRAETDSAQSTVVSSTVEHAVSSVAPLSGADTATIVGGSRHVLQASDNTADPEAPGPHQAPITGSGDPSLTGITHSGGEEVWVDGDDQRTATVRASTTSSCVVAATSVPAGQPCAAAAVNWDWKTHLRASWLIDGQGVELATVDTNGGTDSTAWAARFRLGGTVGNATLGCSTLSGAGCVSAGARSYVPTMHVGRMASPGWYGVNTAPNGLVYIMSYQDTVLLQRGASQSATAGAMTRTAQIYYWNGTGYQLIDVGLATEGTYNTASVYYDGANVTLSASATIGISKPSGKVSGSPPCAEERCRVEADAGLISVTLKVIVEPASGTPYVLETLALINGSNGNAEFTEPVDA